MSVTNFKSPEEKANVPLVVTIEQSTNQDKLSEKSNQSSVINSPCKNYVQNSNNKLNPQADNFDAESNDPSAKSIVSYAPGMKKKKRNKKSKIQDQSNKGSIIEEEDKLSEEFDKDIDKNVIKEEDEDMEKLKEDESISEGPIRNDRFESMDTQTFFYNLKAKKKHNEKFYSDDSNLKRLREIKLERRPIDFENLKKHEQSFLAELYVKKEKRTQKMQDMIKNLQSSYEIDFKSKRYQDHEKNYMGERDCVLKQKEKYAKTMDIKKKYAKKAYEISNSERASQDQEVRERFPMIGKDHMRWFYGRFGKKEYLDNINVTKSKNINSIRYEKGQEYLDRCKELKMPQDKFLLKQQKRIEDQLESDRLGDRRLRAKSNDYLRSIRENRPKGFYDEVNHNNSVNIEKRLDLKAFMKRNVFLKNPIKKTENNNDKIDMDKANNFIEIFNEFDDKARSRERKISNQIKRNKACMEKQPNLLSQKTKPEDMNDYYLTAIKAKLSFLCEIKK